MRGTNIKLLIAVIALSLLGIAETIQAQFRARDPGVRGGSAGAGAAIEGLTAEERGLFAAGLEDFEEVDGVGEGLGPRFNLDSCLGCHAQPATGGSSPAVNPQVAVATAFGARNVVPRFITPDGPVREARFRYKADGTRDGGVHALFVISGRVDESGSAAGCGIEQENFDAQLARNNVIFRIPTPTFGVGLIEQIPDRVITSNQAAAFLLKRALGITGRANRNGNDGTIARFGWKAQNKSLLLFSGEAYNVEMGITNELFQTERDETPGCQFATVPNNVMAGNGGAGAETLSAIEKFSFFMRFLAPPVPSVTAPGGALSIGRGRQVFAFVGCGLCHTPTLRTGNSAVAALRDQNVNLYSDLLVHQMGPGLADDVVQGGAGPDEFRTAPLWGLGQRIFFLHDGRTTDLVDAILAHRSAANLKLGPSEANVVIDRYRTLGEGEKQDLLNFLRAL